MREERDSKEGKGMKGSRRQGRGGDVGKERRREEEGKKIKVRWERRGRWKQGAKEGGVK